MSLDPRMSRKRALVLWAVLAVLAAPRLAVGQAKPVTIRGLFWEAKSPTTTVYLLGSIHLGSKAMYPLPPAIEAAFSRSQTLLVEVDLNKVDQGKIAAQVMQIGLYQGDDTLLKHVDAATAKKLKTFCTQQGLPEMAI